MPAPPAQLLATSLRLTAPRWLLQLSKLTPGLKVAHRKVLLNAVRNASREELTITSFDGLPWRARAAARTLSVRVEGSEEIVSLVVGCDATVDQVVQAALNATGVDGDLLVWDARRQARTKLGSRHMRSLRKADPLVLVPREEPAAAPAAQQQEEGPHDWGADDGGWSDDEPARVPFGASAALDLEPEPEPEPAAAAAIGGVQIMDVKCPAGAESGAMLMVTTSWGDVMQVIVPPGIEPGGAFGVPCFPPPSDSASGGSEQKSLPRLRQVGSGSIES